ncbi:MAG: NAD(P)/FAD-dependent oxidoreductase [Acidobacteriota bacterium]
MAGRGRLAGVRVVVAGAGFAGLAAAWALDQDGADVFVVEARDRVGGRVWTIRDGFAGQHAEAGADLIDSDQVALVKLAQDLSLRTTRILRRGFAFYGLNRAGRMTVQPMPGAFTSTARLLDGMIRDYKVGEQRWDGAVADRLARRSVLDWLNEVKADQAAVQRFRGLRGLFLADPEQLSLLALVDFFATDPWAKETETLRLVEGNDRLATEIAARLTRPPILAAIVRRVRQRATGVVVSVDGRDGLTEIDADYFVSALPASTLRDVVFFPALPAATRDAVTHLRYGAATRLLMQFDTRFWKKRGRPNAFGSAQATGAIWDGNEQQRGRRGILSALAGGRASMELQKLLAARTADGVAASLTWLGRPSKVVAARAITWEDDQWARGGYAFFDPSFSPLWRDLLARPVGRLVFAGEHTSVRWQGYMNGAVETGQRAAAEVAALAAGAASAGPDSGN